MTKRDPEESGEGRSAPRNGKMFTVSYETLVKAFIGCLLALMAWSYNEITSLRQNKADKTEVYREVAAIQTTLKEINDAVGRVENLHITKENKERVPR